MPTRTAPTHSSRRLIGLLAGWALLAALWPAPACGEAAAPATPADPAAAPRTPVRPGDAPRTPANPAAAPRTPVRPADAPHVFVISIDTLRADHLGAYGYGRDTSPWLDGLAARGVLFEDVVSQSTATLTSHLSFLTSLYPPQFRITRADPVNHNQHTTTLRIPDAVTTLAEVFSAAGYRTGAFTGGAVTDPRFGFDQGFDQYRSAKLGEEGLGTRVAWFEQWLDEAPADDRPLFVFLHTYDVHDPYGAKQPVPAPFDAEAAAAFTASRGFPPTSQGLRENLTAPTPEDVAAVAALYDDGIRGVDEGLRALEATLRARGLWSQALIAVVSDHGEEFFEHGGWAHGPSVYRELAHVPWLLRFSGDRFAGTRRRTPVQLLDLAPTLVDAVGLPLPAAWRGRSAMPLVRGEVPDLPRGSADDDGELQYTDIPNMLVGLCAVRRGRFKLVLDRKQRRAWLYDLLADPGETHDLADDRPDVVQSMGAAYDAWLKELRENSREFLAEEIPDADLSDMRAESEQRLRALGYLR